MAMLKGEDGKDIIQEAFRTSQVVSLMFRDAVPCEPEEV